MTGIGGAVVAAGCAAAAASLLVGPARIGSTAPPPRSSTRRAGSWAVPALGVGLVLLVPVVPVRHLVLAALAVLAVAAFRQRTGSARAERLAGQRQQRVVDFAEALTGELRAGQPTVTAVERSVDVWPEASGVARAARLGADVPDALRALARRPGAEGVARLAAAWELSAASGTGLAQAAARVLETARSRQDAERKVRAEVASARATARLVTALPIVVLVAAQGAGARPWVFLTGHPLGLGCLAVGGALSWAGLVWIDRIAAAAAEGAG